MALEDNIYKRREARLNDSDVKEKSPVPYILQGVTKERIADVLKVIDRYSLDQTDAIYALLDDQEPSWYSSAPKGTTFCDGAGTAHIACHIGIMQRGTRKLDREGRDYWLKPMWELGAIEKVYYDSKNKRFIYGHPVAKSSNCAYRLAVDFKAILQAPDREWRELLSAWVGEDKIRQRLELQAQLAEDARKQSDTKHSDLIKTSCEHYVPRFLIDYEVVYIDDGDGDRVTEIDRVMLAEAGLVITLDDSMPDVLLWNRETDHLWVIEAVTSDGEADLHKVANLQKLVNRSGKSGIGFTTTYQTWKVAAQRQGKYKNIPHGTYIWIQEDPSKHFLAEAFDAD
jgi:hypothetical protein